MHKRTHSSLVSLAAAFAIATAGLLPLASTNAVTNPVEENVDFSTPVDLTPGLTPVEPCVEPNTLPYPCPVDPGNVAPTADSQSLATVQDGQLPIVLTGSDPDGNALTYAIVYGPEHGTWEPAPFPGPTGYGIVYTPDAGFVGSDLIKFNVSDGQLTSESAAVYIEVKPKPSANHAPVAYPADYVTTVDQAIPVMLAATDEDGDELTYTVYDPTNGKVGPSALPAIGAYTYTPDAGFIGTDYIHFLVNDGEVDSNIAKVTVVVKDEPTEPPAVAEVSATPPAGTYVGGQSVTLAAEGADSIRYTTDGSTPNCSVAMPESIVEPNGTLYEGAISVPSSLTIRAIACYPMGYHSEVGVFPYTINTPPSGGGGGGGGAPLPLPGFSPNPIGGTVLGAFTVQPRVLGEATCSNPIVSVADEKAKVKKVDASMVARLRGRILLQTERCGEAWYLDPVSSKRYYLRDGLAAYEVLSKLGLGITRENVNKLHVGIEPRFHEHDGDGDGLPDMLEGGLGTIPTVPDTDADGASDGSEVLVNGTNPFGTGNQAYSSTLATMLRGRILLQVQENGEAWYMYPVDGKRYYMHAPAATRDGSGAYQIMRYLSLGISDADIAKIPVGELN